MSRTFEINQFAPDVWQLKRSLDDNPLAVICYRTEAEAVQAGKDWSKEA